MSLFVPESFSTLSRVSPYSFRHLLCLRNSNPPSRFTVRLPLEPQFSIRLVPSLSVVFTAENPPAQSFSIYVNGPIHAPAQTGVLLIITVNLICQYKQQNTTTVFQSFQRVICCIERSLGISASKSSFGAGL